MNSLRVIFISGLFITTLSAQAGIQIGGTRVIYDGKKKEASLNITNPDNNPYLIQSWVEPAEGSTVKAPFVITPPLFRLDGGQSNILRIIQAGPLASDKETMYWMDIKSIPSSAKREGVNTLQIAVKTRIKLIYRPVLLTDTPEKFASKLQWQRNGSQLKVTNPTPYYMNFHSIKVGTVSLPDVTYVAPMSSAVFAVPKNSNGPISWRVINDYGGIGDIHNN